MPSARGATSRRSRTASRRPFPASSWYTATWAYNGLAYVNNPNNPKLDAGRGVWNGSGSYAYQEKIFGWIEHPPNGYWQSVALAYPNRADIGGNNGPPSLPEPSCASPTNCTQHRTVHMTACGNPPPPPDMAMKPVDMAAKPADMTAKPPDMTGKPPDLAAKAGDLAGTPMDDMTGIPGDFSVAPDDLATSPVTDDAAASADLASAAGDDAANDDAPVATNDGTTVADGAKADAATPSPSVNGGCGCRIATRGEAGKEGGFLALAAMFLFAFRASSRKKEPDSRRS